MKNYRFKERKNENSLVCDFNVFDDYHFSVKRNYPSRTITEMGIVYSCDLFLL